MDSNSSFQLHSFRACRLPQSSPRPTAAAFLLQICSILQMNLERGERGVPLARKDSRETRASLPFTPTKRIQRTSLMKRFLPCMNFYQKKDGMTRSRRLWQSACPRAYLSACQLLSIPLLRLVLSICTSHISFSLATQETVFLNSIGFQCLWREGTVTAAAHFNL
mmetsp:Transcript_26011/g.51011  ORF Transcript_26011/g.51011 Transcript_26011/m.51011 type:complete len:165 (+) Transcript_26011:987-1481(+)